jgi:hypothetical protein
MYGILNSTVNTGLDSEILVEFVAPLSMISNQPVFGADTISLKQIISSQRVQRWELEANIAPSNDVPFYLISSLDSGYDRVLSIRVPQVFRMNKVIPANIVITASSGSPRGSAQINVQGNGIKRIQPGEFINVGTQSKLYVVVAVTPDGSSLSISPSLRAAVTTGDAIKYGKNCTMKARYDSSTKLGMIYKDGVLADPGSAKFIEAL